MTSPLISTHAPYRAALGQPSVEPLNHVPQLTISVQDSGPAGKRDALGELAEDPHFRIKWGSVIESFIQGDASPATAAADLTALCRSSLSGVPGPRFPDVAVSVENTDRLGLPFSRSPSRVTFGSGGDAAAGVPRETDPQGDLPGHGEGAGGPTHVRVAADGDAPAAAAFVALWNRLLEGRVGVPPGTRLNPDLRERLMNLRRRVERSL